ncbi:unnamed protein product [Peniophora sp. CBMAI 1063]|nr:unnamed protein product [Peniophora sp. CBMAI 1063]
MDNHPDGRGVKRPQAGVSPEPIEAPLKRARAPEATTPTHAATSTVTAGSDPAGVPANIVYPSASTLDPYLSMGRSRVFAAQYEEMHHFQWFVQTNDTIEGILAEHTIETPSERTPWAMFLALSNEHHAANSEIGRLRHEVGVAQSSAIEAYARGRAAQRDDVRRLEDRNTRQRTMIFNLERRLEEKAADNQHLELAAQQARTSYQSATEDLRIEREAHARTQTLLSQARAFIGYIMSGFKGGVNRAMVAAAQSLNSQDS